MGLMSLIVIRASWPHYCRAIDEQTDGYDLLNYMKEASY